MKQTKKKGDLPSGFIVVIILLLIGFAILLIFLFRFLWQERIDRETCHTSVILRGTASSVSGLTEDFVPLKCKTAKYCITAKLIGKGNCPEFKGEEKEVTKIRVSGGDKGKEDIERFLAREIIDCWSMMGEGKLSLFTQYFAQEYGLGGVYPTCVICSRIAFDKESLEKAGIDLDALDVNNYMRTHKIPDKDISYFEYLTGEYGHFKISDELFESGATITLTPELEQEKNNLYIENKTRYFDFGKDSMTVLFMQISAPKHEDVLANTLGKAAAILGLSFLYKKGAFLTTVTTKNPLIRNSLGRFVEGSGKIVSKTVLTPLAKIIGTLVVIGTAAQQAMVYYQRSFTATKCQDIVLGNEARDGCSVIRVVPYNIEDITSYCSVIESIP